MWLSDVMFPGLLLYFSSANIMPSDMEVVKIKRWLLRRRRRKGVLVVSAGCRGGGKGSKNALWPKLCLDGLLRKEEL